MYSNHPTIKKLQQNNLLRIIEEPLDIDLEIPHVAYIEAKNPKGKALLFTNPVSKKLDKSYQTPVLMNIFGSYKATKLFIGQDPNKIAKEIENLLHINPPSNIGEKISLLGKMFSMKNIFPKRSKKQGKSQEIIIKENINLMDIPILQTWSEDGGPFITMGQVYTKSLDGKMNNLGMYRLQIYDKNHLGLHWQIHKDSASFFDEYKKQNKKMPVSIAIGGDPLLTWCATAPLPKGMFELLMYGFIKKTPAKLVKSITNDIFVPNDADFVIEGFVDPNIMQTEGPFGDHTGYYTPKDDFPVLEVSAITHSKNPIYYATVVGKPPLEDKYMGWATERIFLPLLKTTAPELIDYKMPENGVFHNLLLAKIDTRYPGHAKQFMHTFWGVGQMSFVKHALFLGKDATLNDYDKLASYILNRLSPKNILISEGICDELDHASPQKCIGGKLGIDATGDILPTHSKEIIQDNELLTKIQKQSKDIITLKQYKTNTSTPITMIFVNKTCNIKTYIEKIKNILISHTKLVIFLDEHNQDMTIYMLIWRIVNNIDALRDIDITNDLYTIDATNKNDLDNYTRNWPKDTNCDPQIIQYLTNRGIIRDDKELLKKFCILR